MVVWLPVAFVARRMCPGSVMATTITMPVAAVAVSGAPDRSVVAMGACAGDVAPAMMAIPSTPVIIIGGSTHIDRAVTIRQRGITVATIKASASIIVGV